MQVQLVKRCRQRRAQLGKTFDVWGAHHFKAGELPVTVAGQRLKNGCRELVFLACLVLGRENDLVIQACHDLLCTLLVSKAVQGPTL